MWFDNVVYFADTKYAPFGNKSKSKLIERLTYSVGYLIQKYNPSGIVLACNTATTAAISSLRKTYPNTIFIGTEPAINLAKKNNFKSAAIIATPATIKSLKRNTKTNKSDIMLKFIPLKHFATQIEQFMLTKCIYNYYKVLKSVYNIKKLASFGECIVLGCTHYVLVKDLIKQVINKPIFDGNNGVSANIKQKFSNFYPAKSTVRLVISSNNVEIKENYEKILKQILANQTKLC